MAANIIKPETWVRYRPSLCKGCWAGCCTLPVKVSAEDLYHMGFITYREVNASLPKLFIRLKKEGIVRSLNLRSEVFTLAQRPNHDCIFLDEKRLCTIYERRPSVCRSFPENSKRPGYCPSQRKEKGGYGK